MRLVDRIAIRRHNWTDLEERFDAAGDVFLSLPHHLQRRFAEAAGPALPRQSSKVPSKAGSSLKKDLTWILKRLWRSGKEIAIALQQFPFGKTRAEGDVSRAARILLDNRPNHK